MKARDLRAGMIIAERTPHGNIKKYPISTVNYGRGNPRLARFVFVGLSKTGTVWVYHEKDAVSVI